MPLPRWSEAQHIQASAAAKRIAADPEIMQFIFGSGSRFGDDESMIGGYKRSLLEELMEPNGKYDKNQCASACGMLDVLLAHFQELAELDLSL